MKIFGTPADPIGVIEASISQLRRRRDFLATKFPEAKSGCEKAQSGWQTALDGGDSKVLEKAGARLSESKGLVNLLEAELDDHARQIAIAESELSFAQTRAAREAKAARLDMQVAALQPVFKEYLEVSGRVSQELAGIEGLFDAEAAAAIVKNTADAVQGAHDSIVGQMKYLATELRRDPPPRAPEPPKLPAGTLPRRIMLDRNDQHEPPMWAGNRAFP